MTKVSPLMTAMGAAIDWGWDTEPSSKWASVRRDQTTINEDSGSASGTATLKVRSAYDPTNTVMQATVNWSILFI